MVSFSFTIYYLFLPLLFGVSSFFLVKLIIIANQNSKVTVVTQKSINYNIFNYARREVKVTIALELFKILTLKGNLSNWTCLNTFIIIFLLVFWFSFAIFFFFLIKKEKNNSVFYTVVALSLWFYLLLLSFTFIDNLIILLLGLELLSVFYYFFFLNQLNSSILTIIKLKNLLANYLMLSYFTLVCYIIGIIICYVYTGTTKFTQLCATQSVIPFYGWYFIFFSILWKIGSPGFHFFKLELYQYLPLNILIFFSLLSVYFNTFLILFFFFNFLPFFIYFKYTILIITLIINIFLLVRGLKLNSFYHFLALSAVNTWTTIIIMLII